MVMVFQMWEKWREKEVQTQHHFSWSVLRGVSLRRRAWGILVSGLSHSGKSLGSVRGGGRG